MEQELSASPSSSVDGYGLLQELHFISCIRHRGEGGGGQSDDDDGGDDGAVPLYEKLVELEK